MRRVLKDSVAHLIGILTRMDMDVGEMNKSQARSSQPSQIQRHIRK